MRTASFYAGLLTSQLALAAAYVIANPPLAEASDTPRRGKVVEVIDGDTVALDGGAQVRLVGLQAPKLPLGRPGFKTWPLAEAAAASCVAASSMIALSGLVAVKVRFCSLPFSS